MKAMLALISVLFVSVVSNASERISYACDEGFGNVTVEFNDVGRAVAIYGIPEENDPQGTDAAKAQSYVSEFNLRVSRQKNGIIFTVVTDDHLGETQDVRCRRVQQ